MSKNNIEVTTITSGVYYITIKDTDVRILCAAPADIVKLLMKKDQITSKMEDGFFWESGPNVILLSDVTIQNFSFSNLCEFPVLQMLYRQGMIIPNHPNNIGKKPIIMGLKDQVDSQIEYIFRGNYGLINQAEIENAGIDSKTAASMMNMKLKFAFGQIKSPKELLENIYLDDNQKVEISAGIYIQRDDLNIYKIYYNNEEVEVNLNLKEDESYEIPYELDFFSLKKSYFSIIHSGQGDGWNVNNPSMSSVVMFQGKIYLIDAGPNIQNILLSLGIGLNDISGIFHTHGHDDHFAGLTQLLKIDHKIKYFATKLVRVSVMKKLSALLNISQDRLDNCFEYIDLEVDKWNDVDGLEVKPIFSPHPIETNIFLFRTFWLNGFKTYAHLADLTSFKVLDTMVTDKQNQIGITQEFCDQIKKSYLIPASLKKVDAGGGMIHGELQDFSEDTSLKIIQAHTSNTKSVNDESDMFSRVKFGDVDELIPTRKDYLRHSIAYYIKDLFPKIQKSKIQVLMNCEIKSFKPKEVIIRENEKNDNVFLLLTGAIQSQSSYTNKNKTIFSGVLIGDISAMTENESNETYTTTSYVHALVIPKDIYTHFIGYDYLSEILMSRMTLGVVIEEFDIFNEFLSINTQNKITESFKQIHLDKDQDFKITESGLYLLTSGKLEVCGNESCSVIFEHGDFAHETIFDRTDNIYTYNVLANCEIYMIPRDVIECIPIIYLKVYSAYQKTKKILF